ncbi:hypothetical protein TB1_004855 [Malus domestica]
MVARMHCCLLLGARSSTSLLPCGVVQKTAAGICCVVPFVTTFLGGDVAVWCCARDYSGDLLCSAFDHSFPSVMPLPCGAVIETATGICCVVSLIIVFPRWCLCRVVL